MHLALDPTLMPTRELDNFVLTLPAYIGDEYAVRGHLVSVYATYSNQSHAARY